MTKKQTEALQQIAEGNGIVGKGAPNLNVVHSLTKKGLVEGRGWESNPYRLTDEGRKEVSR